MKYILTKIRKLSELKKLNYSFYFSDRSYILKLDHQEVINETSKKKFEQKLDQLIVKSLN